mmetsp:Transcript_6712/g.27374  ORF Transcript_6712/g.27374 Transcript_6712/m.27374 type:complete len:364 (-) Transcript_6712:238-1329(-)
MRPLGAARLARHAAALRAHRCPVAQRGANTHGGRARGSARKCRGAVHCVAAAWPLRVYRHPGSVAVSDRAARDDAAAARVGSRCAFAPTAQLPACRSRARRSGCCGRLLLRHDGAHGDRPHALPARERRAQRSSSHVAERGLPRLVVPLAAALGRVRQARAPERRHDQRVVGQRSCGAGRWLPAQRGGRRERPGDKPDVQLGVFHGSDRHCHGRIGARREPPRRRRRTRGQGGLRDRCAPGARVDAVGGRARRCPATQYWRRLQRLRGRARAPARRVSHPCLLRCLRWPDGDPHRRPSRGWKAEPPRARRRCSLLGDWPAGGVRSRLRAHQCGRARSGGWPVVGHHFPLRLRVRDGLSHRLAA